MDYLTNAMGSSYNYGTRTSARSYAQDSVSEGDTARTTPLDLGEAVIQDTGSSSEVDKIREFSVRQLNYGYIVTVGCHTFAIESAVKLGALISEYLKDPNKIETQWFKGELL